MRLRSGILALSLVLAASLTACGSDDDKKTSSNEPAASSAPSEATSSDADPTGVAGGDVDCAKFLEGQAKAAELASEVRPGTDLSGAIEAAAAQFDALKTGAPENIQKALDGVKDAFTELANQYKNPTALDPDKVQDLLTNLQANALTLNQFIAEKCPS